jgi:hypothetical protein
MESVYTHGNRMRGLLARLSVGENVSDKEHFKLV